MVMALSRYGIFTNLYHAPTDARARAGRRTTHCIHCVCTAILIVQFRNAKTECIGKTIVYVSTVGERNEARGKKQDDYRIACEESLL